MVAPGTDTSAVFTGDVSYDIGGMIEVAPPDGPSTGDYKEVLMPKTEKKMSEDCVLDLDPNKCPHHEACRYWLRAERRCDYKAIKNREKEQRRQQDFDEYDTSESVMRITRMS